MFLIVGNLSIISNLFEDYNIKLYALYARINRNVRTKCITFGEEVGAIRELGQKI